VLADTTPTRSLRAELRALADADLFALAQTEQRAVVTEDISDLSDIANAYDQRGQAHYGLVLADPGRYPRSNPRTTGRMVTALDFLLGEHPETSLTSWRDWL
jgi:hypothetical protein